MYFTYFILCAFFVIFEKITTEQTKKNFIVENNFFLFLCKHPGVDLWQSLMLHKHDGQIAPTKSGSKDLPFCLFKFCRITQC